MELLTSKNAHIGAKKTAMGHAKKTNTAIHKMPYIGFRAMVKFEVVTQKYIPGKM